MACLMNHDCLGFGVVQVMFFICMSMRVFLLLPLVSQAADPDQVQDFCVAVLDTSTLGNPIINSGAFPCKPTSEVNSEDFFFDGFRTNRKKGENNTTSNEVLFGSRLTQGNVLTFPGLNTLGIAMNQVQISPGGLNPPHLHPRASECGVVITGKVLVGFVTSAGNVYYSKNLTKGQMFVIPRGLVHFQMNVGRKNALIYTAFNSQLPGAVVLPLTLFASNPLIPEEVLTKAFQVDPHILHGIRAKFGA
ncbi:unnamed protein product [Cuscuta epithymum]|uniref:Germin-like protein n=1 Tax=Cuscuta epithymum TaxID=186058 RepID=A0AAV0DDJ5_9ASTE|nr:unnamed protein product [Cuscuta epithymum]